MKVLWCSRFSNMPMSCHCLTRHCNNLNHSVLSGNMDVLVIEKLKLKSEHCISTLVNDRLSGQTSQIYGSSISKVCQCLW
jgi:hypothetical protein